MTDTAYVAVMNPTESALMWPILRRLLEPSIRRTRGRFTMDGARSMLFQNKWDPWIMNHDDDKGACAAAIAGAVEYPAGKRVYTVFFLAGTRMSSWLPDFLGAIESRAKDLGCIAIETGGRRGWKRILSRYGYWDTGEVRMEKEV